MKGTQDFPQIAGFEIEEMLYRGPTAWTCRARQTSLNRLVALKVLNSKIAQDETQVERFLREARMAAKLRHPNIVALHNVAMCSATGLRYISFEYVDGPSLDEVLRERKTLPEAEALGIALGIARALTCAEENQTVHCDLRPEKILLTLGGVPKLSDLGMANSRYARSQAIVGTTRLGSPFYMAPEFAQSREKVDHRADLYSLGITLFHMLTGELPYANKRVVERAEALREEGIPLPAGASEGAGRVVQRLAAWNPDDRYATAALAVKALEALEPDVANPEHRGSVSKFLFNTIKASPTKKESFTLEVWVERDRRELSRKGFEDQVSVIIGRSEGCDVQIDDGVVSRMHAEINYVDGGFSVAPLSSTNATSVNGERIHEATNLEPNDMIVISDDYYVHASWTIRKGDGGTAAWSAADGATADGDTEAERWLDGLAGEGGTGVVSGDGTTRDVEVGGGGTQAVGGAAEQILGLIEPAAQTDAGTDDAPTKAWVASGVRAAFDKMSDGDDGTTVGWGVEADAAEEDTEDQHTIAVCDARGLSDDEAKSAGVWDSTKVWTGDDERRERIAEEAQAAGAVLKFFIGDFEPLVASELTQFGSDSVCDVQLLEPAPGKVALVIRLGDSYRLVNVCDEPHAVTLHNEPVPDQAELADGDLLTIGDLKIRFATQ